MTTLLGQIIKAVIENHLCQVDVSVLPLPVATLQRRQRSDPVDPALRDRSGWISANSNCTTRNDAVIIDFQAEGMIEFTKVNMVRDMLFYHPTIKENLI